MRHGTAPTSRWWKEAALAAAWGVSFALVFPWADWWALAHLCLVPLTVLALAGGPGWRVVGLVYMSAAVWTLVMTSWIRPLFPVGFALMALYMPVYPAAYVLLLRLIRRWRRVPLVLLVPAAWVGLEWVRGAWAMGGFPYFLMAQSQPTTFIQTADIWGVYGVSFVVCMTSGTVCDMILPIRTESEARRGGEISNLISRSSNLKSLTPWVSMSLWLLALSGSILYGRWRIEQTPAGGEGLRVAVVQSNIPQSRKLTATDAQKAADFETLVKLSERAVSKPGPAAPHPGPPVDLIAWPETAVPRALDDKSIGMFEDARGYRRRIEELASRHGVTMIVGALAVPWGAENLPPGSWYNSAYLVTPTGITARYDKVHRLPFGEYIPWVEDHPEARKFMQRLMPAGRREYWITRGRTYTVFEVPQRGPGGRVFRVAVPICFEDVMTETPRKMVWGEGGAKRVDVLVNISNDGWFARSSQGPQHEQMARFRCVENRVPMARAVNTGVSGFIDSAGRILARVEADGKTQDIAAHAAATLTPDPRITLFSRLGDAVPIGCAILTALLAAFAATSGLVARLRALE